MTDEVHARPLLIAPPQINKFYVFDLVPQKSIIQFALKGGLQPFAVSWKNLDVRARATSGSILTLARSRRPSM